MTRKASAKKGKAAPQPEPLRVFIVVREMPSESRSYTEPDRVFATVKAAQEHADQLNRELREFTNPFANEREPDWLMSSEKAFFKLLKKLKIAEPKPPKGSAYVQWEQWWAQLATELTEAQRDAFWDAFNKFHWYEVQETTLED
ncbi:MAG TPA: hypothetical protein VGE74_26390 [Gemmata sp.]